MALTHTIDKLTGELEDIKGKLDLYTSSDCESQLKTKKRKRRTATAVPRFFQCVHCEKAYGYSLLSSEGSLLQHVRLKHDKEGRDEEESN